MSRLTELLAEVHKTDARTAAALESEIAARQSGQRTFGLVFEKHMPEAVELHSVKVRRGSKVHVLPPRSTESTEDPKLWKIEHLEDVSKARMAHLVSLEPRKEGMEPERRIEPVEDLAYVAEFDDPIFPGLVETGRIERGPKGAPEHVVINAENFHALEMLTYTHRQAIDAIYIDPPYNTGAKDWKYNNNYIAIDDDYRHSKWLSFMERRLLLAKELLNPIDSVLIVTIDEKEYLRLGLLLEQLFPDGTIQMISSVINPAGAGRKTEFSRTDEYIFCVRLGQASVSPEARTVSKVPVVWDTLRRSSLAQQRGRKGRGACGPNQFYPIYVDPISGLISDIGDPLPETTPVDQVASRNGMVPVLPIRPDGTEMNWGVTPDVARSRLASGYLRAGKSEPSKPQKYVISYLTGGVIHDIETGSAVVEGRAPDGSVIAHHPEGRDRMPTTQWNKASHDAQRYGTEMLKSLIPDRTFPYPKSLYAVEDTLRHFIGNKPHATVLDFFAGSGTTAHATMRLNRQDGGRRSSISITNNEVSSSEQGNLTKRGLRPGDPEWQAQGICALITIPRITAAITGLNSLGSEPVSKAGGTAKPALYKFIDESPMSEGFSETARFFTLSYESPRAVRHHRAFARIAPILWMRAGSKGDVIETLGEEGWAVTESYGVVQNIDHAESFAAALAVSGARMAFIVTDDMGVFQSIARSMPADVRSVRLYESYLKNFEINIGRRA